MPEEPDPVAIPGVPDWAVPAPLDWPELGPVELMEPEFTPAPPEDCAPLGAFMS